MDYSLTRPNDRNTTPGKELTDEALYKSVLFGKLDENDRLGQEEFNLAVRFWSILLFR